MPVPDRAYVQFRVETAYGSQGMPTVPDLLTYLAWCREGERRRQRSEQSNVRRRRAVKDDGRGRESGARGVDPEVVHARLASDHT
jgi:hypothetical protein